MGDRHGRVRNSHCACKRTRCTTTRGPNYLHGVQRTADGTYLADGLADSQYDAKVKVKAQGYLPSPEKQTPLKS